MAGSRRPRARARAAPRRPTRLGPAAIRRLFARLRAANPAPRTELAYASPYQLLVAVILSAQATDKSVNRATRPLFEVAGTPEGMIALGEPGLARHIRTIGLWRMKAKNILATTRLLLERHGGAVPATREALEALPGVGRKTANVVLNTAFGQPTIAVDTHIFRVANRTGLAPGRNVREVEDRLNEVTPAEFRQDAHHWLILHGRYVCTARKPGCPHCPIRGICLWRAKTTAAAAATSSG
jgi:endonuclease III